jgi:hypothetical protein
MKARKIIPRNPPPVKKKPKYLVPGGNVVELDVEIKSKKILQKALKNAV